MEPSQEVAHSILRACEVMQRKLDAHNVEDSVASSTQAVEGLRFAKIAGVKLGRTLLRFPIGPDLFDPPLCFFDGSLGEINAHIFIHLHFAEPLAVLIYILASAT